MGARRPAAVAAVAQFVALAICANASASSACAATGVQPTAATAHDAAAAIVCEINGLRAADGLPPLRANPRLASAAQRFAHDMSSRHYFSHVTPGGVGLTARVKRTGYLRGAAWSSLSEDIDWGSNVFSTPLAAAQGWMQSSPHRKNILDPGMHDIGVGVAQGAAWPGGEQGVFYVADFGTRQAARSSRRRT
jgi:uncharacterized protein YkwD